MLQAIIIKAPECFTGRSPVTVKGSLSAVQERETRLWLSFAGDFRLYSLSMAVSVSCWRTRSQMMNNYDPQKLQVQLCGG